MELSYQSWCSLSDDDLAERDIAEANLFAAYNLPFAGKLEISALQKELDEWAEIVEFATVRAKAGSARVQSRDLSDNQFNILVMVTVLQRNLGVKYNLAFMEGEYDAIDSRNLFYTAFCKGTEERASRCPYSMPRSDGGLAIRSGSG